MSYIACLIVDESVAHPTGYKAVNRTIFPTKQECEDWIAQTTPITRRIWYRAVDADHEPGRSVIRAMGPGVLAR